MPKKASRSQHSKVEKRQARVRLRQTVYGVVVVDNGHNRQFSPRGSPLCFILKTEVTSVKEKNWPSLNTRLLVERPVFTSIDEAKKGFIEIFAKKTGGYISEDRIVVLEGYF